MNSAGRCKCFEDPIPCTSCSIDEATRAVSGVRANVTTRQYVPDPMRDRASAFLTGGYLRRGYDTGRNY